MKHQAQIMMTKAIEDLRDQFVIDTKNYHQEKIDFEVKIRRDMEKLVEPIIKLQTKHREQFIHNIHSINDHESRLAFTEYTIFKSNNKEDRFDDVLRKIAEMEQQRVGDNEANKNSFRSYKQSIDDHVFNQDKKLEVV